MLWEEVEGQIELSDILPDADPAYTAAEALAAQRGFITPGAISFSQKISVEAASKIYDDLVKNGRITGKGRYIPLECPKA